MMSIVFLSSYDQFHLPTPKPPAISCLLLFYTYCALSHLALKTMLKIKAIIPFYT